MKPLIVLLITFCIAMFITWALNEFDAELSARIAMSVMLMFTALGHFKFTKGIAMMVPAFIPFKTEIIYLTGAIEIAAAAGLLIPQLSKLTAWLLILFFIIMLPANVNAAIRRIDYEKGTFEGNGPKYLWFRVPLQLLFILWTYFSAIGV